MSAAEVIEEIKKLPREEKEEVFAFLTLDVASAREVLDKPRLGKKLTFEDACDVVFRENRELLELLAK